MARSRTGAMTQRYKKWFDEGQTVVCGLCSKPITDREQISTDHIYPYAEGGTNYLANLQPAHKRCNNIKGTGTPKERARFKLLKGIDI